MEPSTRRRIIEPKYNKIQNERSMEEKTKKFNDDKCPICWENYDCDNKIYILSCYHKYHTECISRSIESPLFDRCPLCSKEMDVNDYNTLTISYSDVLSNLISIFKNLELIVTMGTILTILINYCFFSLNFQKKLIIIISFGICILDSISVFRGYHPCRLTKYKILLLFSLIFSLNANIFFDLYVTK